MMNYEKKCRKRWNMAGGTGVVGMAQLKVYVLEGES